jgi:hypothetical protein
MVASAASAPLHKLTAANATPAKRLLFIDIAPTFAGPRTPARLSALLTNDICHSRTAKIDWRKPVI